MKINTIKSFGSYTKASVPNIFTIRTINSKSNTIVLYPATGQQLNKNTDVFSQIVINYENLETSTIIEQ